MEPTMPDPDVANTLPSSPAVEGLQDYAARSAAYDRCAAYLDGLKSPDPQEARANAWVAERLRTDAWSWREMSRKPVPASGACAPSSVGATTPPRAGKPLTDRVVETLQAFLAGSKVEAQEFFSWPMWRHPSGPNSPARWSIGRPTRSMLEGLDERGLLAVAKRGSTWMVDINDAGAQALAAHEERRKARKPSPFSRITVSFVSDSSGGKRSSLTATSARTDDEAIKKVKAELARRVTNDVYRDFRVEGKSRL
ncbi:hypothetical protein [Acidovorax sp. sic0104]|uniref:hypothetical protein n=1 Tax=Acidovorax sp. sic0104 TaxID=2854784 RepID=UPI001C43EAC4|nr:hypothetical protein [Acidovorax sp. sic0104]MBV7542047.1 hypothetical protein [Acidovorax sp. sic0104]